jgi:hypothetical protein
VGLKSAFLLCFFLLCFFSSAIFHHTGRHPATLFCFKRETGPDHTTPTPVPSSPPPMRLHAPLHVARYDRGCLFLATAAVAAADAAPGCHVPTRHGDGGVTMTSSSSGMTTMNSSGSATTMSHSGGTMTPSGSGSMITTSSSSGTMTTSGSSSTMTTSSSRGEHSAYFSFILYSIS